MHNMFPYLLQVAWQVWDIGCRFGTLAFNIQLHIFLRRVNSLFLLKEINVLAYQVSSIHFFKKLMI